MYNMQNIKANWQTELSWQTLTPRTPSQKSHWVNLINYVSLKMKISGLLLHLVASTTGPLKKIQTKYWKNNKKLKTKQTIRKLWKTRIQKNKDFIDDHWRPIDGNPCNIKYMKDLAKKYQYTNQFIIIYIFMKLSILIEERAGNFNRKEKMREKNSLLSPIPVITGGKWTIYFWEYHCIIMIIVVYILYPGTN